MAYKGYIDMRINLKKSFSICLMMVFISGCFYINQPIKERKSRELNTTSPITKNEISTKKKAIQRVSYPKYKIQRSSSIANTNTIKNFDFNIIKKGFEDNNTLLIVGGIQGDEPGGFTAASLIVTHYKITKGSVWVVPNLNFYSIIKRSRGPYGDMNRKFANLAKTDPEYEAVQRIKKYINEENVKLVVNLHDGSGFYRPKYEDKEHSPLKWGQCSIIDQEQIKDHKYENLFKISNNVVKHLNKHLIKPEHIYHQHNTRTREGDKEMEKTLTYYAINQGKAAFGNEASKNLPTHERTYYHLLALEKYMDTMGIEYERKFKLNELIVKDIINNDIEISLYNNTIKLPLSKIRNILNYFPVKNDGTIDFVPSNPLMSIIKKNNEYSIYYGNRRLSRLNADYMEYTNEMKNITINIDNLDKKTSFGSLIIVNDQFKIYPIKDYRVNVIGYTNNKEKETNIAINRNKMMENYSIDKEGSIYRIEFYSKEKFAGMILVKFDGVILK
ncbi:MAG: hypothetical protein ACI81I_000751 [Arcobacteraceae bacterium]|jgi:hypothetical protein